MMLKVAERWFERRAMGAGITRIGAHAFSSKPGPNFSGCFRYNTERRKGDPVVNGAGFLRITEPESSRGRREAHGVAVRE
ncbi:MAG: hypothetical protein ACLQAT_14790 [Candidatus Binataceae bacterium]